MKWLWAPRAWMAGQWQNQVQLSIDEHGLWGDVRVNSPPTPDAEILSAPVLPGLVNAHSHAFQRQIIGRTEYRADAHDDFWSWRTSMYAAADRMTPETLEQVAQRLYKDLLLGGYTHVCEFHYLHRDHNGEKYAESAAMIQALVSAADTAGIGLTILPTLYERAGFLEPTLRREQRRFAANAELTLDLYHQVRALNRTNHRAGVAIHSLRAATPASIQQLLAGLSGTHTPIHIHVAEQTAEVQDCLSAYGHGPIEWLARHEFLDSRWHLVHATHATRSELDAVATHDAALVICPTTEANLGDGIADFPYWLDANVSVSIGSDSHVTRAWPEEIRWLEYVQRLAERRRNICAAPKIGKQDTAGRLFDLLSVGGGRAAGFNRWGIVRGARADLLQIDTTDSLLQDVEDQHLLSALIFGSPLRTFSRVMVGGRWVV